jgi:hypothetical protein
MVAIARARARSSKLLVAALLVALSVLALASAAPASPTTPILDDFNRGLEDPLTQWENWEPQSIDGSGPTLEALGGGAGVDEGDVHADSYRTEPLPPDDAEVYGTIGVNPSDQRSMYLYLNIQDELMEKHGCHRCGTKDPGTTSGDAVGDHQPPKALGDPDSFYPHCLTCARQQGGRVAQEKRRRGGH